VSLKVSVESIRPNNKILNIGNMGRPRVHEIRSQSFTQSL